MIPMMSQIELAEVKGVITTSFADIGNTIQENSYWALSTYTMLVPIILREVLYLISLPQLSVAGPLGNYIDAACSAVVGMNQLQDDKSHRPVTTKLKGVVNISSAVQLGVLTTINFSLYGGPAIAAGAGAGFLISLDDTVRAIRRRYDVGYWLKDSLAELDRIDKLVPKLSTDIATLDISIRNKRKDNKLGRMGEWALKRKRDRLAELKLTKEKIEGDIRHRYVYRVDKEQYKKDCSIFVEHLKNRPDFLNNLNIDPVSAGNREEKIQKECNTKIKDAVKNNVIFGLAFVGILLICFAFPPAQIVGIALVGAASAIFLAKNSYKFYSWTKDTFFKQRANNDPVPADDNTSPEHNSVSQQK
jgi:hypothetical protein